MEKTGFYAGSFDPFTVRHLTIVKAAAASLKRIIIAVDAAPEKEMTFSAERRVQLVKSSLSDFVRIGQLFREMPNCDLFRNEADRRPLPENWTDCIEVVTFSGDPFKAVLPQGLTYLLRTLRKTTLRLRKIRISSNRSADTVDIPRNCLPFRQTYAKKHFFTCPLCK